VRWTAVVLAASLAAGLPARADAYDPSMLIYPPFRHCLGLHKVTQFHAFIYLGTRTRLDDPGAVSAVKLVAEDDPRTARDDDELTVFGVNTARCEIIYNTSLTSADVFGECGTGPGQFRAPLGIAAEPNGNVFVADTGNHRIVRLVYRDDRLHYAGSFGLEGAGDGRFRSPSSVAVGASGALCIADTGNDRIVIATREGTTLGSFSGDPSTGLALDGPTAVALAEADEEWTAVGRDVVVVVDRRGSRLTAFTKDGRLVASALAGELPLGNVRFDQVAIDFYGSVHATDTARSQIHKFDASLRYVGSFGRHGDGPLELDGPRGITIWRRFGQVFVTERTGAQYFWIGTEIRELGARAAALQGGGRELRLSYFLTETSRVTVEVLDGSGRVLLTPVAARRRAIGANEETVDAGALPAAAVRVRVTAAPTYSSGRYFHDTEETAVDLR
jgi:hypothetical protein